MSKCKRMCKNCMVIELKGRLKEFCSDKCRMQFKRKSNSKPEQAKVEQITTPYRAARAPGPQFPIRDELKQVPDLPAGINEEMYGDSLTPGSLQHYYQYPDKYCPRQEPEKMNWGPWMTTEQLKQAGLRANRTPLPGDWDWEGNVKDIEYQFRVGALTA